MFMSRRNFSDPRPERLCRALSLELFNRQYGGNSLRKS